MVQMGDSARDQVVLDLAIESLRQSGHLHLRVQGTSMLPAVRPGTYASIERAGSDQIVCGDIVLTKTPAGVRLHRVVEICGTQFITRGDNHRHADPPVCGEDILGKFVGPRPGVLARLRRWVKAA